MPYHPPVSSMPPGPAQGSGISRLQCLPPSDSLPRRRSFAGRRPSSARSPLSLSGFPPEYKGLYQKAIEHRIRRSTTWPHKNVPSDTLSSISPMRLPTWGVARMPIVSVRISSAFRVRFADNR